MKVDQLQDKREQEKQTIRFMIELYCRKLHKEEWRRNHGILCSECQELLEYTYQKIERCPKMEEKTFCASCPIHCYQKERREQVRNVMKWAGPRMMIYNPKLAIKHLIDTKIKGKEHAE
ncbi:MAG: nitrous oxide-stimulated promoter family protein [Eubacteriales bacterium]